MHCPDCTSIHHLLKYSMNSLGSWTSSLVNLLSSSSYLSSFIPESNPIILLNHITQAFFFSLAICNLIAVLLKIAHFAYAEDLASSRISQLLGLILLFYLKIWDYYAGVLYILSIFSLALLSLYVYDCCGNISHSFDNWR